MLHEQSQAPFAVERVTRGGVVDRIVVRVGAGAFLVEHLEVLGRPERSRSVAVKAYESGIERGNVLREHLLRVALRVERDEEHLHLVGVGPQFLHHFLQFHQGGRANVRATRIAEEHHRHLAAEVGERARLAGVVGEREALGVVGAGDVDVLEFRAARVASREQQEHRDPRGEATPQGSDRRAVPRTAAKGRRWSSGRSCGQGRRCSPRRSEPRTR